MRSLHDVFSVHRNCCAAKAVKVAGYTFTGIFAASSAASVVAADHFPQEWSSVECYMIPAGLAIMTFAAYGTSYFAEKAQRYFEKEKSDILAENFKIQ